MESGQDVSICVFEEMGTTFKLKQPCLYFEAILDAHMIAQAKLSVCRPTQPRLQTVINSQPQQIWLEIDVGDILNIACSVGVMSGTQLEFTALN